jgi:hypothetical protein
MHLNGKAFAGLNCADPIKEARMPRLPTPSEGILLTHFSVSDDVERSRRFYTEVLGGETVFHGDSSKGEPSIIALANRWVTINVGGGPTADHVRRRSAEMGYSTSRRTCPKNRTTSSVASANSMSCAGWCI